MATMQDRLLNAYLVGTIEEAVYKAKSNELKAEAAKPDEALARVGDVNLVTTKRKPLDAFAEGLDLGTSRGDRIRTCDLLNPIQTR